MRSFAVADHGIRSHGGHNLTYAHRVLEAAVAEGWRPVLGVNAQAVSGLGGGIETAAVFRRDPGGINPSVGRLWRTPALGRALWRKATGAKAEGPPAPAGAHGPGRPEVPAPPRPSMLGRAFAVAGAPTDDALAHYRSWRGPQRFGADLARFIEATALQAGDVVLLPTLLSREVLGLAGLLRRSERACALRWRIVLRYPPDGAQGAKLLRRALEVLDRTSAADVRLYTDTDPLAATYQAVLGRPLEVLPIPVEPAFTRPKAPQGGLTVGYFGDARIEKGFGLLPDLVREVRALGGGARDIRFVVQVNLNVARGEPAVAATLAELEAMAGEDLALMDGPFDVAGYRELFHTADLVLVPYDEGAYDVRSSGVFMEAIGAGTPVLVSADSWMAGVLDESGVNPLTPLVAPRSARAIAERIHLIARERAAFTDTADRLHGRLHASYDPVRLVRMVSV